jgi:hypothetical protein
MSRSPNLTRRQFIQLSAGAALGCYLLPGISYAQDATAPKVLLDAAVPGYKLAAIDYVSSVSMIATDSNSALGSAIFMLNLPFPRTSQPVTIYVHTRAASVKDDFLTMNMEAYERDEGKRLDTANPTVAGQWQWLKFKPLIFAQVGDRLRVDARADKSSGQKLEIDDIVLSTDANLDDEALAKIAPLFPTGPIARVDKATIAPTIDGRDDDAAWKDAVAIEDFVTYKALRPASQPTSVRIMHDDKNLYVLFHNTEPLLKTADMRGSEMKTLATTRDGDVVNGKLLHDVLGDDSCMIMLQPRADGPVYEFDVNAKGVMADAKLERNNLWATRDLSWNSNFKAAVRQGDGIWILEMAIPLADIGATAPQVGERWQTIILRNATSRGESTSWNPSGGGAHDPLEMGTLIFGAPQVAATPDSPLQSLQPGINTIAAQISSAAPASIGIVSRIQSPDTKTSVQLNAFATSEKVVDAQHQFDVAASGTVAARWGIVDAATMQPIYLSPEIRTDVQSMSATLKLSTAGAFEVVLNDAVVAHGDKADAKEIPLPLRAGANVIALRADSGIATVAISAPGLERFEEIWRANKAATPDATSSKIDDATWSIVKADAKSTLVASGATVFRRTILVNQTPVWPVPQPALYIAGNSTQQVSFRVKGVPGKSLENWTTYLAVPAALKVMGSTGYYGTTAAGQPEFNCEAAGETIVDGQTLPLYKISATKPLRDNRNAIMSIFQVMLQIADTSQAKEGVSWKLHYWSEADDGTTIEAPRTFEARALPPLNGRQPKTLPWELWGSAFGRMDSEALRIDTLKTMQAAGINYVMSGERWTSDVGPQYGVGNSKSLTFASWSIDLEPYLKQHPDERLIDHNDKPQNDLMCTTLLVDTNWPSAVAPVLTDLLKRDNPALVTYDYEFPPLSGPHSCYCFRCQAAFRERAKLDKNTPLTPRIIEDQYLAQWQDFMAYRAAEILLKMKGTVHQTLTGVPFSVYSLFQSPLTLATYGIDWRYIGQLESVDLAEAGLGRPLDDIRATYEALDGIPLMMGVWMTPYSSDDLSPARATTKAELLRRTLDSTGGMLIYDRNPIDGRSWTAIAETTRLVAQYESTFTGHQLAKINGQDSANVQLIKGENQTLLCLMNDTAKPVSYDFVLPVELGGGKEFYSDKTTLAGGNIQLTLAPGDTAVYVLRH